MWQRLYNLTVTELTLFAQLMSESNRIRDESITQRIIYDLLHVIVLMRWVTGIMGSSSAADGRVRSGTWESLGISSVDYVTLVSDCGVWI